MPSSAREIAARFPADFLWGVATSAYQIEGALDADGRGRSIWEAFAERAGAIERGEDASLACDHYRRRDDDLELLRSLGVGSYRFSIAWPRIQPSGAGPVNRAGLAFYDRLVDGLLEAGIRPFPTLYHWDLPQALEDAGGWAARETSARFADYAGVMLHALGDRVRDWALFNEPFIFTSRGYLLGRYAPGRQSVVDFLRAVHVVTMAHAEGFAAAKASRPDARVGSVFAMAPCEPATDSEDDRAATDYADAVFNHLFLDPLLKGCYPQAFLDSVPLQALAMRAGDTDRLRTPLDFLGVNTYYRLVVSSGGDNRPDLPYFLFDILSDERTTGAHADFSSSVRNVRRIENAFGRSEGKRTAMGWEIWPRALHDVLLSITSAYGAIPIEVCESGCAFDESPASDGVVHDAGRITYHQAHILAVADALRAGANVRSYHAWSLYDNFEWASGYRPRFGLVHVDFATQRRTWKHSAHWYREVCLAARESGHVASRNIAPLHGYGR
ncbi:MAG: family 1 glycosylhydrolase [Gemmatimonadetes bacterium]|jgi:beta-glucosidase|nr:family 1 glycosylhydrolase [Gemmatimonadota bacterium]